MKKLLLLCIIAFQGCSNPQPAAESVEPETETLSRTEFTSRIENFFEYEPLHSGKSSAFLIHLTDLSDGSPVAQAEVTLVAHPAGSRDSPTQVVGQVGKVTGIYVAELTLPRPGNYDIEFQIKNAKFDERMPLSDFKVE